MHLQILLPRGQAAKAVNAQKVNIFENFKKQNKIWDKIFHPPRIGCEGCGWWKSWYLHYKKHNFKLSGFNFCSPADRLRRVWMLKKWILSKISKFSKFELKILLPSGEAAKAAGDEKVDIYTSKAKFQKIKICTFKFCSPADRLRRLWMLKKLIF